MKDKNSNKWILHAGFNWMDMRHIFVTHKHVDHLMGIIWMVRMICQFINGGETIILNGSPRKTGTLQ